MPGFNGAEAKTDNARHIVFCYSELPDFVCSQWEENSRKSRRFCHGHGQLPGCEGAVSRLHNDIQIPCGDIQLPDLDYF